MGQGGFRVDWDIAADDSLTVHSDYYTGEVADTDDRIPSLMPPFSVVRDETGDLSGGNVLARWQHSISDDNDFTVQCYFDRVQRKISDFDAQYNTIDLDFAHRLCWGQDQELIWGLGYRLINDDLTSSPLVTPDSFPVSYNPQSLNTQLFSGFVQNSFALPIDDLRLIVGAKLEHNDYTGFEIQPTVCLLWPPATGSTVRLITRALLGTGGGNKGSASATKSYWRATPSEPSISYPICGSCTPDFRNIRSSPCSSCSFLCWWHWLYRPGFSK